MEKRITTLMNNVRRVANAATDLTGEPVYVAKAIMFETCEQEKFIYFAYTYIKDNDDPKSGILFDTDNLQDVQDLLLDYESKAGSNLLTYLEVKSRQGEHDESNLGNGPVNRESLIDYLNITYSVA